MLDTFRGVPIIIPTPFGHARPWDRQFQQQFQDHVAAAGTYGNHANHATMRTHDKEPQGQMKLAIPDLISNSYFPALAATELGFFEREGIAVSTELIFPVDRAYAALRDGEVDFVGGAAHGSLAAFPEWRGVKLLGALAQGMYWCLVMRADLGIARGDLAALRGRRIGAAPWVEMGLRRLLAAAGLDAARDHIEIGPVPGAVGSTVNFGLTAARHWRRPRSTGSGPTAWRPNWR